MLTGLDEPLFSRTQLIHIPLVRLSTSEFRCVCVCVLLSFYDITVRLGRRQPVGKTASPPSYHRPGVRGSLLLLFSALLRACVRILFFFFPCAPSFVPETPNKFDRRLLYKSLFANARAAAGAEYTLSSRGSAAAYQSYIQ